MSEQIGAQRRDTPQLSIVSTVYRTQQFVAEFVARVTATAEACGLSDHEIILVVDGCPDDPIQGLLRLKISFPRLQIIELSRNFGHHAALWCGLASARGELVFVADSDLETPPEILGEMAGTMSAGEADAVVAFAMTRQDPWAIRLASRLFWRLFSLLADVQIDRGMLTERLMRRRYVEAVLSLGDRSLFLGGMMQWVGFRQAKVLVTRTRRPGRPSYSARKRAVLAFEALTSFSTAPMRLLFVAGSMLASLGVLTALGLTIVKLARPQLIVSGFAALMVLMLFSLGAILSALGLLGLYLGKVFEQTKGRPIYIVRERY